MNIITWAACDAHLDQNTMEKVTFSSRTHSCASGQEITKLNSGRMEASNLVRCILFLSVYSDYGRRWVYCRPNEASIPNFFPISLIVLQILLKAGWGILWYSDVFYTSKCVLSLNFFVLHLKDEYHMCHIYAVIEANATLRVIRQVLSGDFLVQWFYDIKVNEIIHSRSIFHCFITLFQNWFLIAYILILITFCFTVSIRSEVLKGRQFSRRGEEQEE